MNKEKEAEIRNKLQSIQTVLEALEQGKTIPKDLVLQAKGDLEQIKVLIQKG